MFRTEVSAVANPARIDTPTARAKLAPRREPYWHKLQSFGYVGYRRSTDGGSWVARWTTKERTKEYSALGTLEGIAAKDQFDKAGELAREWFRTRGAAPTGPYTVADAIGDYVKDRRVHKSEAAAKDAEQRLNKHLVPVLGSTRLDKLTMAAVARWLEGMVKESDDEDVVRRSRDSANRVLSFAKAAFNLAWRRDLVGSDRAWRRVKAFRDVGAARKVFLSPAQSKALVKAAAPDFRPLIESGLLTGARYGELIAARVKDLDTANMTLRLAGKTGTRDAFLSDAALRHFKKLAKGKLPNAYLHVRDDGEPWAKSHQIRRMRAAVTEANQTGAKIPVDCNFYSLRHTHISRALVAGVNIQVLAENCGTSVRMIEVHYGKFTATDRRAMLNRVEA
jgi:integrase